MPRGRELFQTVRTEGGLLPPELLKRIAEGDRALPGISASDYHLEEGARLSEAITRSWNRLLGAWESFRDARAKLPTGSPDTALTRDRWLLILFQELGFGRLAAARGQVEVDGKAYPISHLWNGTPIHLVGFRTDLDKRAAGVAGAARQSPHSLVQGFLNRNADQLWGFVSNGLLLRLLRDNASLTRQASVEFDLEAMLDGQVYADFALLWLVCHQSRFEQERAAECWLERWVEEARGQGTRALDRLRGGVENAITELGRGFLAHPRNGALREALRSGELSNQDYYRELLRLVYRLLFLLVAEDRGLLLDPDAKPDAKLRYTEHYSMERLRRLAARRRGGPHPDCWRALRLVMERLGRDEGCPELALPALGSFLWSPAAIDHLGRAELANEHLLAAVRALCFTEQGRLLRPVDWRNLDSEELGSVYESLLELHPTVESGAAAFDLTSAAGHERRTTGSYYTPDSLVQCLLDSALDPVLDAACQSKNPEQALLDLTVCDPACGSGHFLIAAGRRIARRLAQVRTGDVEPDPTSLQSALRDVIGHCLYGVDVNPMAVELCKVSLWLGAIEPGKPLSFLDHQIRCGNSLLGTTPQLLAKGVPDEAFEPIEGDDRKIASALKKRNRAERKDPSTQETFFAVFDRGEGDEYDSFSTRAASLRGLPDDTIGGLHRKESSFAQLTGSDEYRRSQLVADAWCAAFVWPKQPGEAEAPTSAVLRMLASSPERVPASTRREVERLVREYAFFHWHLAFPELFSAQASNPGRGFDVVLSNPPWEHTELKEREFFSTRAPEIATAPTGAARKRLIAKLEEDDPALFGAYVNEKRRHDAVGAFAGSSGRYPLCGRGRINLYAIFAEAMRGLIGASGRVGCVVPTGIATDDTTKLFFQDLVDGHSLASLFDFENSLPLFAGVHRSYKFCLLTLLGSGQRTDTAEFAFFLRSTADLSDPDRRFRLSAADIALLNPNTRTCPIFRSRRDAELTKWIFRRVPVLIRDGPPEENPWGISFRQGLFNMTSDSHLFRTRSQLEGEGWRLAGNIFVKREKKMLPLYEAKMIHHFNHRFGDYADRPSDSESTALPEVPIERLQDPSYAPLPRYWVPAPEVESRLADRWPHGWLLGWRDICRSTDERTVIASVVARVAIGHTTPLLFSTAPAPTVMALIANLSALVLDYAARQKIGGTHLTYGYLNQLPVKAPSAFDRVVSWSEASSLVRWLRDRVLELAYTTWDLAPLAKELGHEGPPFRWDETRRLSLRSEIDAVFLHLYLGSSDEWKRKAPPELLAAFATPRDAAAYILDSFPIVRRNDEQAFGEYRTKRVILEIYDDMQRSAETSEPYRTRLDPPPGSDPAARSATSRERR